GGVTSSYSLIQDPVGATINDLGGTITGQNPNLGPLANNGGATLTHLPAGGSPVVDAGNPAAIPGQGVTPAFDQRGIGFDRVRGTAIDIGAVEDQSSTLPVFSSPAAVSVAENTTAVQTLSVVNIPNQSVDFRIFGQAPVGELGPGGSLNIAQTIISPDGSAVLVMQGDGNLVVYISGLPTWASATNGSGAIRTTIQPDGNLTITTAGDSIVYQTNSGSDAGSFARLRVDNAGFPEVVRVDGEVLWRGTLGNTAGGGTVFTPAPLAPGFVQAADTGSFQIVGGNQLQFLAPPDFEAPTDSDSDNVYEVTVLADGGTDGVTPQTISVTVSDLLENGDFDEDQDVDVFDLLALQRGFGISSGATRSDGDADNDGDVDSDDLGVWDATFGEGALPVTGVSAGSASGLANALGYSTQDEEEDLIDAVFGRWS
ncbi:MAG: choice-of-anchor Q domain-containing protein, partial [Planctomycetota bacterium]